MKWFKVQCPTCGRDGVHRRLGPVMYSPVALVIIGGVVLPLIFELSRKPRFRCINCGSVFTRHTMVSRFFQIFWIWFITALVFALVAVLAGTIARK